MWGEVSVLGLSMGEVYGKETAGSGEWEGGGIGWTGLVSNEV